MHLIVDIIVTGMTPAAAAATKSFLQLLQLNPAPATPPRLPVLRFGFKTYAL